MASSMSCLLILLSCLIISGFPVISYSLDADVRKMEISGSGDSASSLGEPLMHNSLRNNDFVESHSPQRESTTQQYVERPESLGLVDKYMCKPCTCHNTTSGAIIADCSTKNLPDIPAELPRTIFRLNMSQNNIETFETAKVLEYPNLSELTITSNSRLSRIHIKSGHTDNTTSVLQQFDLSDCNISSIGPRSFKLMTMLQELTLTSNRIHTISNLTFEGLEQLKKLDLSNNDIRILQPGAFDHLTNLMTLNISLNRHLGYFTTRLPPVLFRSLQKLKHLYMQGIYNGDIRYPNEALGQLKNLRKLKMDALPNDAILGVEIRSLEKLTLLEMGTDGVCKLTILNSSFFDNLPFLQNFTLSGCKLKRLDPNAYVKLKANNLTALTLIKLSQYDLYTALEDLEHLQNSSLKNLRLVQLFYCHCNCRQLTKDHAKYLRNIQLVSLDLSYNRLVSIDSSFADALPKTLKRLVLTSNKLTQANLILNTLRSMQELTELDISSQSINHFSPFPVEVSAEAIPSDMEHGSLPVTSYYKVKPPGCEKKADLFKEIILSSMSASSYNIVATSFNVEDEAGNEVTQHYMGLTLKDFPVPPKLKVVKAANCNSFKNVIFSAPLDQDSSLEDIDVSSSFMTHCGNGIMPAGIKNADLSNNYCRTMHVGFFQPNNLLINLNLRNNLLGDAFAYDNGSLFFELKQLKYLDISLNTIYRLPKNFLSGLQSVETVKLNENKLMYLSLNLSNMKKLKFLDFSKNAITYITKHVRDHLDDINAMHPLNIDLSLNPLPCMCKDLELLQWMANTKVNLINSDFISCRFDDGRLEDMGDISERLRSLQRQCTSVDTTICIYMSCIIVFSVTVSFALIYRCRWKLRYSLNITVAKLVGFKPKMIRKVRYKYDAYFIYTDDSRSFVLRDCIRELEVKRGHKICVEDRDFMPGIAAVTGIVSAVQNSTKTVPVITPDFYNEDYSSEYSVKMAIMEELHKNRSVLHLCVWKPMPEERMSQCHDLLMVKGRNNYTEYPAEEESSEELRERFWNQLSLAIGHTDTHRSRLISETS